MHFGFRQPQKPVFDEETGELNYQMLIEHAPTAFFLADDRGNYRDVNQAACNLLGYNRSELLELGISDVIHPDDQPLAMDHFMKLRKGVGERTTLRMVRKDGSVIWVFINAVQLSPKRYFAFCEDVTDQRVDLERKMRSEEQLSELFDNISDGIAIYVAEEGGRNFVVKRINKSGLKISSGEEEKDVVGQLVTDVFPGVQKMGLFSVFQDVWRSGKPRHYPFSQYVDEHVSIWVDNYVFKLPSGEVVAVFQDLTAQKKNEDERAALQLQLLQAQKLDAIGRLAGGVAHDFNNLLHVLRGYMEMMGECLEQGTEAQRYLEAMGKVSNRAEELVSQLLAYSRKQLMKMDYVDINDVALSFVKLVERIIGENIVLKFCPDNAIGLVKVDVGQIEQVFMNLCVNARDAMPSGGTLTIETSELIADEVFCQNHIWAEKQSYICISFCDTGTGMEKGIQEKIFEPFFTTKDVGKGSGLGLSMVLGIIKQHDGGVYVYSEPGQGSCVKLYLPATDVSIETSALRPSQSPVSSGTETILLAEDDEMVRDIGQQSLRSAGYRVLTASDGEDALCVFNAHMDEIDMVVLDIVMPKLNGREVFRRMRELNPQVRVLFNSGYSLNTFSSREAFGNEPIVQKPYSRATLLRAIRDVLDRA